MNEGTILSTYLQMAIFTCYLPLIRFFFCFYVIKKLSVKSQLKYYIIQHYILAKCCYFRKIWCFLLIDKTHLFDRCSLRPQFGDMYTFIFFRNNGITFTQIYKTLVHHIFFSKSYIILHILYYLKYHHSRKPRFSLPKFSNKICCF